MDRKDVEERFSDPGFQEEQRRTKETDWQQNSLLPSQVFAMRLRETRKARGLTQVELARRVQSSGRRISPTALVRVERCVRGLSLDEAFALTEALQAVPLYMLTPPADTAIRMSENVATDGAGLREWFVSGIPGRGGPDSIPPDRDHRRDPRRTSPPDEIADDVRRHKFQENMVRLALALVDAVRARAGGEKAALEAIGREVLRREKERDVHEGRAWRESADSE